MYSSFPSLGRRILNGRVDKYSTIVIDQNRYSVPDYLVGEVVRMKVYSDSIQCFYHEEKSQLIAVKQGIRSGVYNSIIM